MYHNNQQQQYYSHPDMSWAIARQDEALEDLMQSTRQVIKRHTNYMSDTNRYNTPDPILQQQYYHRPSYSKQRSSCSHRHKPTHMYPPPPPPQQQYYNNRSYTPQSYNSHYVEPPSHHKSQHRHYVTPHPQPLPPPPAPPPPPREYYNNKSPEDSFSKTRKWLNRFIMPQPPKQKRIQQDIDDDVGLLELKEKIRRSSSKPKLPPINSSSSSSRPMIIPAFTKTNPEKVIVIDVPLDITVIFRSVDQKEAEMYHVTDLSLIENILGGPPVTTATTTKKALGKPTMKTSFTMPNLPSRPSTVMLSSKQEEKKKGLTKYFSSMNISNMKDFNYVDSDDSTIEQPALSPSNSMTNTSISSSSEEEYNRPPRSKSSTSNKRWMV